MPMVPPQAFPFCGPSNIAASPVIDAQSSVNLYPDPGLPSSKTQMALVGRPGMALFSDRSAAGAGHSLWAGNGRLFAAVGGHVYELNNAGGVTTDYGLGLTVGQPVPTPMVPNGTQLLICDPVAKKVFNVNPAGPSLDLVFNGVALEYLDGFYVSIATGASLAGTNPNQINVSANGDGTTWPALSYAIRTGSADLTIQLAVLNSLLYIFGQKTIEVWYDAGNAVFPFARVNGGTINLGCVAAQSVVKFQNTIMWLGGSDTGSAQVYMMNGMNPVRVSNAAIESMIQSMASQSNLPYAKAFGYQEAGHTFYQISFCNSSYQTVAGLSNLKLVYDLTTGLWHQRSYSLAGTIPTGFASVPNFGATWPSFAIGENGKVCYQSQTYTSDLGTAITYTRTAPHSSNENKWIKYPRLELDCDIGTAAPVLDYSNDGGKTFLGLSVPMRQAQDQGTRGTFRRFYATQLGRSRDRVFKVTITDDSNQIRIVNAYLTAEASNER